MVLEGKPRRDAELGGKSKPVQQEGNKRLLAFAQGCKQARRLESGRKRGSQCYKGATGEGDPLLTRRDAGLRLLEQSRAKEVISYRTYQSGG